LNRRVPNGTHGGVRGREIYLNFPPTRLRKRTHKFSFYLEKLL